MAEKDLSLLKQELEVIKKEASAPRSPTRLVGLVKMIYMYVIVHVAWYK